MLKRTKFYILLTLVVITGLASGVNTKTLNGKERNFAVNHLKKSKENLLKKVKHLSEAQLNFKPTDTSWSVKECVQHLALSEKELWGWAESVLQQPSNSNKQAEIKITDEELIKFVLDRSNKSKAVESLQPSKAALKDFEEILDNFKDERSKLIKYTRTTTEDARSHVTNSQLGYLDAYQIILIISAHTARHTEQIDEIKTHPQFPK